MDTFSTDELAMLMQQPQGPCVSLFMPTHRAGPEIQQDRTRLKVLLAQAEEGLGALGVRTPDTERLLGPGHALVEDGLFWQRQADGLALFLIEGGHRRYRVPLPLKELVVVADRCDPTPLLPLLTASERFHLLALSLKQARLFEGSRFALKELALSGAPAGLEDALKYDDFEKEQVQFHTRSPSPGGGGRRPPVFHGTGEVDRKDEIVRYFRAVDAAVMDRLRGETVPLVLAGVDYLLPLYREATSHPAPALRGVEGNPDQADLGSLHAEAWATARPLLEERVAVTLERYGDLDGGGRTVADPARTVAAAFQGRVDVLFLAQEREVWGRFDPDTGRAKVHRSQQVGDSDLLGEAALYTLAHGGTVLSVEPERMPKPGAAVAAILRF